MASATTSLLDHEKTIQGRSEKIATEGDAKEYVDYVLSSVGFGLFQIIAFVLAGMTCISYVCESLTFAFVSVKVTHLWNISSFVYASVPASTCITNIIGQVVVGYFSDNYGRKWPYVATLFVSGTFILASAFAKSFLVFGVLRNLAAIGIGGTFVVKIPMLMEFLPVNRRGIVAISTGLIETLGQCVVAGIAWWLVPSYSKGWRYFIMVSSIPSFVTCFFFILFVESPRSLVTLGKTKQAWKVFSMIASINGRKLDSIVVKDDFFHRISLFNDCKKHKQSVKISSLSKLAAIFNSQYLRRSICFMFVLTIANCVSFNTTLFLPNYLNALKLNPYFITLVGITAQLPGISLIAIIVEWPGFGRLNTLRIFTFLLLVFLLLFAFIQNEVATPIFIVLVYFSLVPSLGLLVTYISESYPTEIRVMTMALMTTIVGINGTWFPFVSGYATDLSKQYSWVSPSYLAVVTAIQFIFTLVLNHETRGKELSDIVR